jgi:signal transduction histidine kinase
MAKRLSVISIDDDPGDARLLERCFEAIPDWDVDFRAFQDSISAISNFVEEPPDILFLDYRMGAMNGLEVLRTIRETGIDLPVIILTGQGNEELVVEALAVGATDYVTKCTLAPEAIRRSVSNAIEKHVLRKALDEQRERLQRTNRELVSRNEEIKRFYQTLSHELRTPLTAAKEFVSIMLDGLSGDITDEQEGHLRIVLDSCDHMMMHINDLLDVTRMETGKLDLDVREVDVGQLLRQVVASLEPRARESEISLKLFVARGIPGVHMDARRITQVLSNLIRNALKFTPPGGEIAVRATRPSSGDEIEIAVEDTGPGIPAEDRSRVFDRLFQVHDSEELRRGGIGLGLHLCRELVRLHGGDIRIECPADGGTHVRFTLPRSRLARETEPVLETEKDLV